MLLIDCPYCGERPELEFAYGGQAHIARPRTPAESRRPGLGRFSLHARQHQGRACRALAPSRGCGRFFNALRDTTTDHFLATYEYRRAQAQPAAAGRGRERRVSRASAAGASTAAGPLHFTFDGRDYTGFAGDTLASALLANGVHLVGPLVQIPPAARHPRRRLRGAERAGHRVPRRGAPDAQPAGHPGRALRRPRCRTARTAGRASQLDVGAVNDWLSPFFPAGFYYKTFMWPREAWKAAGTSR